LVENTSDTVESVDRDCIPSICGESSDLKNILEKQQKFSFIKLVVD